MDTRLLTGIASALLLLSPVIYAQDKKPSPTGATETKASGMSSDMQEAIRFQRAKDRADARQARMEASNPSVGANANNADRRVEETEQGRKVKDTKAPGAKRDPRDQ